MAIITCPHCGYQQASAAKCMNCGTLFATPRPAATSKSPQAGPTSAGTRSALPVKPAEPAPRPDLAPKPAAPADARTVSVSVPASVATQDADETAASVPPEPAPAPTAIPEMPVPSGEATSEAPTTHVSAAAEASSGNGASSPAQSVEDESPLPASLSAELSDALTAALSDVAVPSEELPASDLDPAPVSAAAQDPPPAKEPAPISEAVAAPAAATPVSDAPAAKPAVPVAARSTVVPSLFGGALTGAPARPELKSAAKPAPKPAASTAAKPIAKPAAKTAAAAPQVTASDAPQAAPKPARSGFARFWSVARWFMLASLIATVALILHRASPPDVADTPQAAAQADAQFAQAQAQVRAGQPAEVRLNQAELTSFLDANLALGGGATAQQDPSSVRDVKITMDGDALHAYVLFGFHGEELSLVLDGRLGVADGALQFTPLGGQVGSLPLPRMALDAAISRMMSSPENRAKLRVPDTVRDIRVENSQLVIDYR